MNFRKAEATPARPSQWNEKDLLLLKNAKAGNNDAHAELLNQTKPKIRSVLKRFYQLTKEDKEDLEQETYIRLLEKMPTYEPDTSLGIYAAKVARNLVYNHLARENTLKRGGPQMVSLDELETQKRFKALSSKRFGEATNRNENFDAISEKLRQAMEKVPEPFKTALKTHYYNDDDAPKTLEETAKNLNIKTGTLKSRLFRGHAHLQKILGIRENPNREKNK